MSAGNSTGSSFHFIPFSLKAGDYEFLSKTKPGFLPERDHATANLPENKDRNRYDDILPYESSRVKLMAGANDYINANHLAYKKGSTSLHYIAAQGPTHNTAQHFWEMIWEQNVDIVVMLTGIVDNAGVEKCYQYWPSNHPNDDAFKNADNIRKASMSVKKSRTYCPGHQ